MALQMGLFLASMANGGNKKAIILIGGQLTAKTKTDWHGLEHWFVKLLKKHWIFVSTKSQFWSLQRNVLTLDFNEKPGPFILTHKSAKICFAYSSSFLNEVNYALNVQVFTSSLSFSWKRHYISLHLVTKHF